MVMTVTVTIPADPSKFVISVNAVKDKRKSGFDTVFLRYLSSCILTSLIVTRIDPSALYKTVTK